MMEHPEASNENLFEPTIGEQFRFEEFKRGLEKLDDVDELRQVAVLLARQAMIIQPATIRFLAKEAANNLCSSSGSDWSDVATEMREHLMSNEVE